MNYINKDVEDYLVQVVFMFESVVIDLLICVLYSLTYDLQLVICETYNSYFTITKETFKLSLCKPSSKDTLR